MKRIAIILVIFLTSLFVFFELATLTKKPTSDLVVTPVTTTTINSLDQSYLTIKLLTDKYEVSLFEKSISTSQIDSIEKFITKNESQIGKDKIAVVGNEKMKGFQAISSLLKKHGVTKFRLNPE